jgi:hypothetical protein
MMIITQGYDYAIPTKSRNPFIHFTRIFPVGIGQFLYYPLLSKGFYGSEEQRSVVAAMIDEFNEMLIECGKDYVNVYHIDCRGITSSEKDWRDELHPQTRIFKKIAQVYMRCMEEGRGRADNRVYRVEELYGGDKSKDPPK